MLGGFPRRSPGSRRIKFTRISQAVHTTHAVRAAIQRSQAAIKELAAQHGLDPKTVAKWKKRAFVHDAPMGPEAGSFLGPHPG